MQKLHSLAFTLALAIAANGQKINTEPSDRNRVIRLQTAPNHLSVIELAEPVKEVASGSPAFKIEWRDNKVFIQPLEPDAATDLFIWTGSQRLTYELVTGASIEQAQFAIDQAPSPITVKPTQQPQTAADQTLIEQGRLAKNIIFQGYPIWYAGQRKPNTRVQVVLRDLYRSDNHVYVRYALENDGRTNYQPGPPRVFTLRSPQSARSLVQLAGSQLGTGIRVKAEGTTPLKVVTDDVRPTEVLPGTLANGLVAFELPAAATATGPAVVRFDFPADAAGVVTAYLVL